MCRLQLMVCDLHISPRAPSLLRRQSRNRYLDYLDAMMQCSASCLSGFYAIFMLFVIYSHETVIITWTHKIDHRDWGRA